MHIRTPRSLLVGLSAGLMMTGVALAAPASALVGSTDDPGTTEAASRLPFQAEVARIYPDLTDGTRVTRPGTGITGPASGLTDEYDEACLGEQVRVRGTSGRTAVYRSGAEAPRAVPKPSVQERTFPTAADARGAFAEMRSAVRECKGGTYRTRTEDYTWSQRSVPVVGQDRLGWSLRSKTTEGTTVDLHYLVLRDDRLIHTVVSQRDTLPDQARAQRLLRYSLRTLG